MTKYFLKRLLWLVPLFIAVTMICFAVIHLAPGGPVDNEANFNPKMTKAAREKLAEIYGLDQPLHMQYAVWMKRLLKGDLGKSFVDGVAVSTKMRQAIPVTLVISVPSIALGIFLGVLLAIASVRLGSGARGFLVFFSLAAISIPSFWMSMQLVSLLAVQWAVLPASGLRSVFAGEMTGLARRWDLMKHLVLPISVCALPVMGVVTRFISQKLDEELSKNYIRTARAKGLSERAVLFRHALPNALLPLITILGLSVPSLVGGSVVLESIFAIPGMGRLFFQSVFTRDYPVIMGLLLCGASLTLLGNWLSDIGYALVDPRIRTRVRHE